MDGGHQPKVQHVPAIFLKAKPRALAERLLEYEEFELSGRQTHGKLINSG
jgi:hypothetical protein